jgi:hypothetical protein
MTRISHAASNNRTHNIPPRITIEPTATAAPTTSAREIHRCGPPPRLLSRLTPGMVLQHLCDLCHQQGHKVAHEIQLGVVEAPFLADQQHRPVLQEPLRPPTPTCTRSCRTSYSAPTVSAPPRGLANGWTTQALATTSPPSCGTSSMPCSWPQ